MKFVRVIIDGQEYYRKEDGFDEETVVIPTENAPRRQKAGKAFRTFTKKCEETALLFGEAVTNFFLTFKKGEDKKKEE